MFYWTFFVFFIVSLNQVNPLENGLAHTPPMGWMSWGYYMCGTKCESDTDKCLDEKLILSVVDKIYTEGYQEAGYEYIIIDDCWSEKKRENGRLVPDKKRFPRGMKFLADYIHAKGLKFGMYTNIAKITCMQFPGSKGYFSIDAPTFAEWGVDYLKVDGCFVSEDELNTGKSVLMTYAFGNNASGIVDFLDIPAYISLGGSLNRTGRPMVYSCSWPYYIQHIHGEKPDYKSVAAHCNLWRNFHDVVMSWNALIGIIMFYSHNYKELSSHHGPGHWNDPDMLILGTNSLTDSQSRVHLAIYAMWSAPLLLSCDMSKITPYEKELLLNLDLIAIAQDPLGIMAKPYHLSPHLTVWVKPHHPIKGDIYPSHSFAFVNLNIFDEEVTFRPKKYGLNSSDAYTVYVRFLYNIDDFEVETPVLILKGIWCDDK